MTTTDPALKHAITPPAFEKGKLHREDLVDRLHAAVEKALVVVAAPAGYGKTTLMADFTAHTNLRVCWTRLGAGQYDDVAFAQLIVASLHQAFRKSRRKGAPRFSAASPPESTARILSAWIEEAVVDSFVLVVDDVHELAAGSRGLAFLDEFISLRPSAVSVIAMGRAVPEVSLARLMAEGGLAGFGPNDLAFSREEVEALLTAMYPGVHTLDQANRIHDLSNGWVTGVVLSAIVKGGALSAVATQTSPLVYDYLSSVVMNRLPDDLRRFVLDASVFPVMTPEMCDRLLHRSDSAAILRQCLRRGVFLDVSGGEEPTYSFHSLFRSFLVETQSATEPSRHARLRARAASLLERYGMPESAFQLLVEGRNVERAVRLVEAHAQGMFRRGRIETLERWLRVLQDSGAFAPELMLTLAAVYMDRGDLSSATELAKAIEARGKHDLSFGRTARLTSLRAGILYRRGEYAESVKVADKVIRDTGARGDKTTLAVALEVKGLSLAAQRMRLEDAKRATERAVELHRAKDDTLGVLRALRNLGVVLEAQGDYRGLASVVERASSLLKGAGPPTETSYALNNIANVRHKEGQFEVALSSYGEALKAARQAAHPFLEALVLFGQADIFNDVGMAYQAAQLYGGGLDIAAKIENRFLVQYGCLQTASLYRRRGNLPVGHEWIKRALKEEDRESRHAATLLQMAGVESVAAPKNAVSSLERILKGHPTGLSGEEEVQAKVFLVKAYLALHEREKPIGIAQEALSIAGARGAEQVVSAELAADSVLRGFFETNLAGNPVLEVVLGRIDAMESFRRLHVVPRADSGVGRRVKVTAFGHGRITVEGRLLAGWKRQEREMFFFLVDKGAASRDLLAEVFWPSHPPGRRAANMHTAVHSIRALLGRSSILLEGGVYSLDPGIDLEFDVAQFEKAAAIAERLPVGDPRRFFALNEAISLYSGPFLGNITSPWASERRRELEIRYLDLTSELAVEALTRDQPRRAIEYLRRGLAVDPLRDDFNLRYLEALGRLGQTSEASAHYQHYTRLVREELGIDPPDEIRALFSKLIG